MKFDDVLKVIGGFGRFQKIRFFLICLFAIVSGWHALNMVFVGATPKFVCRLPQVNLSSPLMRNFTKYELNRLLIPEKDQCHHYDLQETLALLQQPGKDLNSIVTNTTRKIVDCSAGYDYSTDQYQETLPSEFDLVCDDRIWMATSKTVFFFGRLCGALVFGHLADRFGRRPTILISIAALLLAGSVAAFAPNMYVFLPMYFCQGASITGAFTVSYILATELVAPKYRVLVGFAISSFYSVGYMTLAGMSFLIGHWRYLELAITVPVLFFSIYYCLLPESVRWLLSHGKFQKAEDIIQDVATVNGVKLEKDIVAALKEETTVDASKEYHLLDCVRTWSMAKLSVNIWFNWAVNAMVYYGLSLNTGNLGGNPYLNFCIAGAVEIPAYILCVLLLDRVGRRWPLIISMYVGGIACIVSGAIPTAEDEVNPLAIGLAMVGKFGITASYSITYLLAAELFPTVIRNIGMGAANMSARIGSMFCPFILELSSVYKPLPLLVYGSFSVLAGTFVFWLPETMGKPLPQLPEDIERRGESSCVPCCKRETNSVEMTDYTYKDTRAC